MPTVPNKTASAEAEKVETVAKPKTKYIEVETLKPYAPFGFYDEDTDEYSLQSDNVLDDGKTVINVKIPAFTKVRLPEQEATRILQNGVARVTNNTFK